MKGFFRSAAILFYLAASPILSPAQEQDKEAANVRALESKWAESRRQHQSDVLSSLLAEDFVITMQDGTVYNKAGYVVRSAEESALIDVAELSDLKVRMHGDTAVVTAAYHETGESKGKRYEYSDRLTDVWMKIGGKWQVLASQHSVPIK